MDFDFGYVLLLASSHIPKVKVHINNKGLASSNTYPKSKSIHLDRYNDNADYDSFFGMSVQYSFGWRSPTGALFTALAHDQHCKRWQHWKNYWICTSKYSKFLSNKVTIFDLAFRFKAQQPNHHNLKVGMISPQNSKCCMKLKYFNVHFQWQASPLHQRQVKYIEQPNSPITNWHAKRDITLLKSKMSDQVDSRMCNFDIWRYRDRDILVKKLFVVHTTFLMLPGKVIFICNICFL